MSVSAPGYESATFELEDLDENDLGDFELTPAFSLRGKVLRSDGKPAQGAEVSCGRCQGHAFSDAKGRFALHAETSSDPVYQVIARTATQAGSVTAAARDADWQQIGPNTELTLVLKPFVRLFGQVSEPDGSAARGATIALRADGYPKIAQNTAPGQTFCRAGERGRYEVLVPASVYSVKVEGERVSHHLRLRVDGVAQRQDFGPSSGSARLTIRTSRRNMALFLCRLGPETATLPWRERCHWSSHVTSDDESVATASGLIAGTYVLTESADPSEMPRDMVTLSVKGDQEVFFQSSSKEPDRKSPDIDDAIDDLYQGSHSAQ